MLKLFIMRLIIILLLSLIVVADETTRVSSNTETKDELTTPSGESSDEESVDQSTGDVISNTTTEEKTLSNAILLYRRLLRQKREMQKDAVKMILASGSYEKQYKMIKMIFSKLFTVLTQSKVRLTEAGFTPGDAFPTADDVKDALSTVLENTAFAGDIILRLPDISHNLLKGNSEWNLLIEWGIGFCNDTLIFTGNDAVLLNTMAQELNLVEKDPTYVNPYREDTKLSKMAAEELERTLAESKKRAERAKVREKKKKKKGPRMSASPHNEL